MLQIVQLQDGCYKVTVDYSNDEGFAIHREWIFTETDSNAQPMKGGERIELEFK